MELDKIYHGDAEGHTKTWPVDMEAFVSAFEKSGKGELVEMTRQVRERELGNGDEAYEVTRFEKGEVVSHYWGG